MPTALLVTPARLCLSQQTEADIVFLRGEAPMRRLIIATDKWQSATCRQDYARAARTMGSQACTPGCASLLQAALPSW